MSSSRPDFQHANHNVNITEERRFNVTEIKDAHPGDTLTIYNKALDSVTLVFSAKLSNSGILGMTLASCGRGMITMGRDDGEVVIKESDPGTPIVLKIKMAGSTV